MRALFLFIFVHSIHHSTVHSLRPQLRAMGFVSCSDDGLGHRFPDAVPGTTVALSLSIAYDRECWDKEPLGTF